jgi:methionyl-tRNA synthetase
LVAPFLPESAEKIREALGLSEGDFARLDLPWGEAFADGHQLGEPINLFPRV